MTQEAFVRNSSFESCFDGDEAFVYYYQYVASTGFMQPILTIKDDLFEGGEPGLVISSDDEHFNKYSLADPTEIYAAIIGVSTYVRLSLLLERKGLLKPQEERLIPMAELTPWGMIYLSIENINDEDVMPDVMRDVFIDPVPGYLKIEEDSSYYEPIKKAIKKLSQEKPDLFTRQYWKEGAVG